MVAYDVDGNQDVVMYDVDDELGWECDMLLCMIMHMLYFILHVIPFIIETNSHPFFWMLLLHGHHADTQE